MIRLVPDHATLINRTACVEFEFDGRVVTGHAGETVLAALMRAGIRHLRDAPTDGAPRGAFCCIGLCQECLVQIDGARIESCRQIVSGGLTVQSLGRPADG
ncbi:(2Fe-2S)-binding protein [Ruegeria sp. EL01]|jgi:predicted molibdopterin-dependent oxidoreductase YjgC|uniref:(2Fe-2S)-binding protein n=1 Tax=Ruegeria sp. EL01 TaxID=2107578 RepID=UPI000EA83153|nr:(2Fe-2S)-binding protein [Ruegeria sp. EL01]